MLQRLTHRGATLAGVGAPPAARLYGINPARRFAADATSNITITASPTSTSR